MINKKELEKAILNLNHNSDKMWKCMSEGFARNDSQHYDMLGEMKKTNENWFKLTKQLIFVFTILMVGVFAIVGVKLVLPGF